MRSGTHRGERSLRSIEFALGPQGHFMSKTKALNKTRPRLSKEVKSSADIWKLRKTNGIQILEASPLAPYDWLRHGFSTRPGGASELVKTVGGKRKPEKVCNLGYTDWDTRARVDANRATLRAAINAKDMHLIALRQIHSDVIHNIDRAPETPLPGDAVITRTPGLLLSVQTADCVPILIVDPQRRVVAAVHAGWRGTLRRIAGKTVGQMQMLHGSHPKDLAAAIGPAIARCCFEVGPEVVKEFDSQFVNAQEWFEGPYEALVSGEERNPLAWLTMMPPGHVPPPPTAMLDLHAANRAILLQAGLSPQNIFASDLCTATRTDLLFSYRRERETGRMMAVIGIAES
jgi:YfiH family protein